MIKNSLKKIFIKISRFFGFELIDQNKFISPTLKKELSENLSKIANNSIVLPLGKVKISRKIKSIIIIFRTNSNIDIWDQNKKRVFEKSKIEYIIKSLNSLIENINFCNKQFESIKIKTFILDDNSSVINLNIIKQLLDNSKINYELINHDKDKYRDLINKQKSDQTYSNLSSLLTSFEIGKNNAEDLIFFVEDDYIHLKSMLIEVIETYERISSQLGRDIIICPSDYPYLYMSNEKSDILIGSRRHWRSVDKTLCTFFVSKHLVNKYWDNFKTTCIDRHDPFEKYLNEIYKKELCISPLKSLSIHMTNINSSYGLSPFINYKKVWDEN